LLKVAVQRSPAVSLETAMPAVALPGIAVIVTVEPTCVQVVPFVE
jgi:hypothetical protein